jgi:hypothetical protein
MLATDDIPTQMLPFNERLRANAATIPGKTSHESWPGEWSPNSTGKPDPKKRTSKWRSKKVIWAIAIALVLLACVLPSTLTAVNAYSLYSRDSKLASQGIAQLEKGLTLLKGLSSGQISPQVTGEAKDSFGQAYNTFTQVNSDLAQVPGIASSVPHYGSEVQSARKLLPIAIEGAKMGVLGSDALNILIGKLSNPFAANSDGLTTADLKTISDDLTQVQGIFNTMKTQIGQLQPSDLSFNAHLGTEFQKFRTSLPTIEQALQDANTLVALAPSLLGVGTPTNYLIEVLDSTELRPGGGFIGNYGTLTLSAGRLSALHITDVDLLDRPFEFAGGFIPFPAQYQWFPLVNNWSLRDSNLDADFPTDARYAEQNYKLEGGKVQMQGVIAITPFLIQKMLLITGPIFVPEFNETVTASNLIDLIHYHQLGPGHGSDYVPDPGSLSSQRKAFTGYLFKHFLDRVKALATTKRSDFVKLMVLSFQRKDIQMYLNSSQGEALLQQFHIASTIDAPKNGDSLLVVDANITGNKANNFISYTNQDNVTLDAQGNATHHMTLTYNWPVSAASTANDYGDNTEYLDYVRVYAPPQAQLQAQSGWTPEGVSTAFGRRVFAGRFYMKYGSKSSITLTWTVPHAAYQDAQGWHYTLLFQHQAGLIWTANTQLSLPSCAKVTSLNTFKAIPNSTNTYAVQGYLSTDATYGITYTCSA